MKGLRFLVSLIPLPVIVLTVSTFPLTDAAGWSDDPTVNTPISTAAGYQRDPQICSDSLGGAFITWNDNRSGNYDIYAQRVDSEGNVQWTSDGVAICTASSDQRSPQIVSDGSGGAFITWNDTRSGNYDIYAQRVDSEGNVRWTSDGVAICTASSDQQSPQIVSDDSGGALITWTDRRNYDSTAYDIYAQRVDSEGNVQWTSDGVAICAASGIQSDPQICSDGSGGAIIAWKDRRGIKEDIYAQRVGSDGAVQWTSNGVAICTAASYQQDPEICSDGSEGAIIVWTDRRRGTAWADNDIYAQRIDSDGTVQWTSNGVAICTASDTQHNPTVVSDDSGGAIAAWEDRRNGNGDIYVQRVDSGGNAQWTSNGVAICTASRGQDYPRICSDGSGGAIITWGDGRSSYDYDIYARRVGSEGHMQWTEDGAAICTAADNQNYPQICSDGSGGAVITWNDRRNYVSTEYDIYAQRVKSDGSLPRGVAFSSYSYAFDATREFNALKVRIENGKASSVEVYATIEDAPPDIPISFIGLGEPSKPVTLAAGATADLTIGAVLSKADQISYSFGLTLYSRSSESKVEDTAGISLSLPSWDNYDVSVSPSSWDISISNTASSDDLCFDTSQEFTITNTGTEPISDLSVDVAGDLELFLDPQISDFKITPGESVTFKAYGIVDETTPDGAATIQVTGAQFQKTIPVQYTAPTQPGTWSYASALGTTFTSTVKGFVCVNRRDYTVTLILPSDLDVATVSEASVVISFEDRCHSAQRHDTYVSLNGQEVKAWINQVTVGQYEFPVDVSFLQHRNTLSVHTENYRGWGHFCANAYNTLKVEPSSYAVYCPDLLKECTEAHETNFTDGIDNDCDGAVDCDDLDACGSPVCDNPLICPPVEICDNGIDDDGNGLIDEEDWTVCAGPENQPPVADAGPDQTVYEGDVVTLDGSSSTDSDDGIAFYSWTQRGGISVTLSDPAAAQPTFTAPSVGSSGESLTFQLTVTDFSGLSATDDGVITALPGVTSPSVHVSISHATTSSRRMLSIPVAINAQDPTTVSSAEMSITYDSDVVKAYEPSIIGTLAENWSVERRTARGAGTSIDTMHIALTTSVDTVSSGTLFYIRAKASKNASPGDSSGLVFEHCELNGGAVSVETEDGMVRVVSRLGDVSGNGKMSAYDASLILQEVAGLIVLPDPRWSAFLLATADVTGDGTISALDASWILRYAVGSVTRFPAEGGTDAAKVAYGEKEVRFGEVVQLFDGRWVVPVEIDDMEGILAGEVELSYAGGLVVEVRTTDLLSEYLSAVNIEEGRIRASFAGAEWGVGSGPVLEVVFDGAGVGALSSLRLERVSLNEGRIPVRIEGVEVETRKAYRLSQNYPNPFNPETTITYDVAKDGNVRVCVYALTGQHIRTLVDGEHSAGRYSMTWDGTDDTGQAVATGVYLCRMEAGDYSAVRKVLLMR